MSDSYTPEFFINLQEGSKRSAQEIIPLVLSFIHPQSVVDVGCGNGTWLSVFKAFGIADCLGIDGDYIDLNLLQINSEEFLTHDLKFPLKIEKTFDLVISLEVAEHLPSDCAEIFIDSLTRLGDVILFSAAIPYQGGTEHLNEQWPEYWVSYFERYGYVVIDCLRSKIWENDKVEAWYAQNILFFVRQDSLKDYPILQQEFQQGLTSSLARVHPKIYLSKVQSEKQLTLVRSSQMTSSGVELKVNENRFGCFEVEITDVQLFPENMMDSGESLTVEIHYQSHHPIYHPIFSVSLSQEYGIKYFETNSNVLGLSLPLIQGKGEIKLRLDYLKLENGNYFVDVGVYERNWAYTYDYHWHVYPLSVQNKTTNETSIQ